MNKKKIIIGIGVILLLVVISWVLIFRDRIFPSPICDALWTQFIKLYDLPVDTPPQPNDFEEIARNEFTALRDCKVTDIKKTTLTTEWYRSRGITTLYDATFTCDILSFEYEFYQKDTSLFITTRFIGSCQGDQFGGFVDKTSAAYAVKNELETQVISQYTGVKNNSSFFDRNKETDLNFCLEIAKRDPSEKITEDMCYDNKAFYMLFDNEGDYDMTYIDNVYSYCHKIKILSKRMSCYEHLAEGIYNKEHTADAERICKQIAAECPSAEWQQSTQQMCERQKQDQEMLRRIKNTNEKAEFTFNPDPRYTDMDKISCDGEK